MRNEKELVTGGVANLRATSQSSDKNFKLKSYNFSSIEKTFLVHFIWGQEGGGRDITHTQTI